MNAPALKTRDVPSICSECGGDYQKREYLVCEEWTWGSAICQKCEERLNPKKEKTKPIWLVKFEELVPPDMREVKLDLLPDRDGYDKALAWNFQTLTSLLLVGTTGLGKTRALYSKLRVILEANPAIEIAKFDAISFGEESKAKSYVGRGAEWLRYLRRVDLVVFDDLFRGNLNNGVQEELFALISARTEEGLPTMATTQFSEKTLGSVMQEHHVAAIARRFRDYFTVVSFKKPTTKNEKT